MNSPKRSEDLPTDNPEVRAYLKRLITSILIGIILMSATAIWAWNKYGTRLADAPPLPEGTPPLSTVPATTR